MEKSKATLSREQRLAAKLRENLKRRKTDQRARTGSDTGTEDEAAKPADDAPEGSTS